MNFLSLFSKIKKETINSNLKNNKIAWGKNASGLKYIEDQSTLTDLKYGQETPVYTKKISKGSPLNAAFNSCEIIALQNALVALGIKSDANNFPELLSYFEKKGTILKGYFGTAPVKIKKYLLAQKIKIEKLTPSMENYGKTPVQILIFQNGKKLSSGIHTICIVSKNETPVFFNGAPQKDSVPILLWSLSK